MADRTHVNILDSQDARAAAIKKSWEAVMRFQYGGTLEQMVGAELYGPHELDDIGLHNEMLVRTGLIGSAAVAPDHVRQHYPTASYKMQGIMIKGLRRAGAAYEHYPEDLEDVIEGLDFHNELVADLPVLLADTEEEEHFFLWNNGETETGGVFGTPLFVDGTTNKLQLIGQPDFFSTGTGNIFQGGWSYAMAALIHQYGDNFVNEEGRPEAINVAAYVAEGFIADQIEAYYDARFNIETGNSNTTNPLSKRPRPTVYRTKRLANKSDFFVLFEGWRQDIKERSKYRGREESWTEGHAQFMKNVAQIRSRYGYYFINNRRVLLVKGAS